MTAPEPTRLGEVLWLEPFPDILLSDRAPGPEARYEAREAISLPFITALQLLPPRQRAALILRDVLGFPAREAALILETTPEAVTGELRRARAALHRPAPRPAAPPPGSPAECEIVERLTRAFEAADVDGVVALLTGDVWLTMPPGPLQYQGRDLAAQFLAATALRPGMRPRLIPTRANGQPAFGCYLRDPHGGVCREVGVLVLTLSGAQICAMTCFDTSVLARFGLPRMLPEGGGTARTAHDP